MKTIVYLSMRNTLIGKGNFGKPELFEKTLQEIPISNIYSLATEGDASFFDENGETIELDEAIPILKMMLRLEETGSTGKRELLLLYQQQDLELISTLKDHFEGNEKTALVNKEYQLANLDVISGLIGSANNIAYLVGNDVENTVSSLIIAHIVCLQKKKKPVLLKPANLNLYTSLSPSKIIEKIYDYGNTFGENSFISKRVELFKKKTDDVIKHFYKLPQVNLEDIEYLDIHLS